MNTNSNDFFSGTNDVEYEIIEDSSGALKAFTLYLAYTLKGNLKKYFNKLKRQHELDLLYAEPPYYNAEFSPTESIDTLFLLNDGLIRAWNTLTEKQKQVLMFSYIMGFTIKDTAKIMNISQGAVSELLKRATDKIILFENEIFRRGK